MKRINHCDEIVTLLSAARCCIKAIINVAAKQFWFSNIKFVTKLLFNEADKKVSITRSHFSAHSNSVNLFVIVTQERKAVKCENKFREVNKRFNVTVFFFVSWSKKYLTARSTSWLGITVYNEVIFIVKLSLFWPGKL